MQGLPCGEGLETDDDVEEVVEQRPYVVLGAGGGQRELLVGDAAHDGVRGAGGSAGCFAAKGAAWPLLWLAATLSAQLASLVITEPMRRDQCGSE